MVTNVILLILISLVDLFAIIVSFEILSLLILGFCGLSMNKYSTEASIKYFTQNTIITGIVMFGLFFNYFIFKTTNLIMIFYFIDFIFIHKFLIDSLNVLLVISMSLWLLSFLFKLGLFPVNFYVSDVYMGSSSPVILLMSSLIKPVVLFIFIFKISYLINHFKIVINLVCCFCIISILIGDIMAYNSDNVKRFFGYSSVSQYGFVLIASLSNSFDVIFYNFIYLFFYNVSLFFILALIIENRDFELFDITSNIYFNDLGSILKYNYSLKILITFCFILMSGIPPFITFIYKYGIFVQMFNSGNFIFLIIILILNIISFAYYFKIIVDIWFFDTENIKKANVARKRDWKFSSEKNYLTKNSNTFYSFSFLIGLLYLFYVYFDIIYKTFIVIAWFNFFELLPLDHQFIY